MRYKMIFFNSKRTNSPYENLKSYLLLQDLILDIINTDNPYTEDSPNTAENWRLLCNKLETVCQILEENFVEKRVKKIITRLLTTILQDMADEFSSSIKEHIKKTWKNKENIVIAH